MEASLQEKLHSDLTDAMRAKDEVKIGALRMTLASFHKREIEKRGSGGEAMLTPEEEIGIVRSEVKRRKESKEMFLMGGRQDLAAKEDAEIKVLFVYLPPELSREEIETAVSSAIVATGAKTQKDFGLVMKEAMKTLKGKADGGDVSRVIKETLS